MENNEPYFELDTEPLKIASEIDEEEDLDLIADALERVGQKYFDTSFKASMCEEKEGRSEAVEEIRQRLDEFEEEEQDLDSKVAGLREKMSEELGKLRESVKQIEERLDQEDSEEAEESVEDEFDLDKSQRPDMDTDADSSSSGNAEEDETGSSERMNLERFREYSTDERSDKIFEVVKQYQPVTRNRVGNELFEKEVDYSDPEYKEISNHWPSDRVEVAEKDGRTKYYEVKKQAADDVETEDKVSEAETAELLDEEEDEVVEPELPELELTGYSAEEFSDLNRTKQSEVVIQNLMEAGSSTVDELCEMITDEVEEIRVAVHLILEDYWKKIVFSQETEDGDVEYFVAEGVELDDEAYPLGVLQEGKKNKNLYYCMDSETPFERSKEAKEHRKENGYLNWCLKVAPGLMKNWYERNREVRASH